MERNTMKIRKITGALPYLFVIFLNAFIDLGHKIVIQNTIFKVHDGTTQVVLTAIVNSLILLPFIILMSPSGYISDNHPKHAIMKFTAATSVALTLAITLCYYLGWFWPAFAMTFLLAVQSAFFSPAKYSYIKLLFGNDRLGEANGRVQATTVVAILAGTFVFSILFELRYQAEFTDKESIIRALTPLGLVLVLGSIVELLIALKLPNKDPVIQKKPFYWQSYFSGKLIADNLKVITGNNVIKLSIVGLAIFWSVGQVMLAGFPAFAKETLAVTNTILLQGMLAASGVGIAIGSSIAARLSKGYIETGFLPIGALGIALGVSLITVLPTPTLQTLNFVFIGTMGGLFIVPLNALIQFNARNDQLGRVIAANNWAQNICMFAVLILTAAIALVGASSSLLLIIIAICAIIGGIYTTLKLPQSFLRFVLSGLIHGGYRINTQGMNNIPERGGVLLLGNHISWIDWAVVQIACPRPIHFVMQEQLFKRWYLNPILRLFGAIPIRASNSRKALRTVSTYLDQGKVVCLFPEGTISRTGHLAEFRRGFEKACGDVGDGVLILPFYLRGLWGSRFSRASSPNKQPHNSGWRREIIVAFGQPINKDAKAETIKQRVFDLSIHSWRSYIQELPTLPQAWIMSVKQAGINNAFIDSSGESISSSKALAAAIAISRKIKFVSPENNIAILLPSSSANIITNMACLLRGKVVVNLNYSASADALKAAIDNAELKTLYTSKRFMSKLQAKGIDLSFLDDVIDIVYLEELGKLIKQQEKIFSWLMIKLLPSALLQKLLCHNCDSKSTAAILFSSGSEGTPKGVMLSHQNIMANLKQISDVLNTRNSDVIMASLPAFHAFGLTVTQFLPAVESIPVVCHPDPTDAPGIAKAIAKYQGTVLFGTSTLFRLYTKNRRVHSLMLTSLRIVVAGAERLDPQVSDAFKLKFNHSIYEGYGATETTPVASVNLPDVLDIRYWHVQMGQKNSTVGMPLPGTSCRIVDPQTLEELPRNEAGMILIGGVQVMQGYLNNVEKTQEVIREIDGLRWYVTGDKGCIDDDGFLKIIDRYSRFAKIGGEMISLSVVEQQIRDLYDDSGLELVAVNLPDERKGEKILVLCEQTLDLSNTLHSLIKHGANPLSTPSKIYTVDQVPKLGSGKTDFAQSKILALALEAEHDQ